MKNYKRGKAAVVSFDIQDVADSDSVKVDIYSEWGNLKSSDNTAAVTTAGGTQYTLSLAYSKLLVAGKLKLVWKYKVSTVSQTKTSYINVYDQYINAIDFFDSHGELEDEFSDSFEDLELKVEGVINTACGQNFYFRPDESITFDGTDKRTLYLTTRLDQLTTVTLIERTSTQTTESDITSRCEIDPSSNFFLRMIDQGAVFSGWSVGPTFVSSAQFAIDGDWGWPYVPQNVTDAADLILLDWMEDDSAYRKHYVNEVWFERQRMKFDPGAFGSTGNIDADSLLLDYTRFILEEI